MVTKTTEKVICPFCKRPAPFIRKKNKGMIYIKCTEHCKHTYIHISKVEVIK